MKNFLLVIICVALSTIAVAQKKTSNKHKGSKSNSTKSISVPTEVNTAFQAKYADVSKQSWNRKAGGNYVATFTGTDNVKQQVEFDASGVYQRTKSIYTKEQVPEIVTTSLSKNYADAEIQEIVKYEIEGVAPYYKVKIADGAKGKHLLVSEAGDVSE